MNTLLSSWHPRLVALATAAAADDGAHDTNHLHRVWRNATLLMDDYPEADALVVLAACYLHDLVNLPKNSPDRHLASRQAARLASRQLAELGFPPEKLAATAHAIETHSFSAGIKPETIEAKIVQDADRLDALGAVGLARIALTVQQPLAADDYTDSRATGAFILIDEVTHQTVAAGMIKPGGSCL
eukprot:gene33451-37801_t